MSNTECLTRYIFENTLYFMKQRARIQFIVYIEQDEDGVYVGSVPALPSCHAQGDTQEEMLNNLSEVIDLCLRNNKPTDFQKNRFVGIQNLELMHA